MEGGDAGIIYNYKMLIVKILKQAVRDYKYGGKRMQREVREFFQSSLCKEYLEALDISSKKFFSHFFIKRGGGEIRYDFTRDSE